MSPVQTPNGAVILLRLPHSLKDALDAYAFKHDIATSEAIRRACAELVGCTYTQQHGNTRYPDKAAQRKAGRERASKRRSLIRALSNKENANG